MNGFFRRYFGAVSWETIARNCESLLKIDVYCGILEKVEFVG